MARSPKPIGVPADNEAAIRAATDALAAAILAAVP
jgi:hypothetical protein